MNYALFVLLLTLSGQPIQDGAVFDTKANCESAAVKIVENIVAYNVSTENADKIVQYSAVCAPVKKAPQGKAV